ncbi:vesicle-associated membrane protein-associated protein B/C-like [Centruroides sculpturatus]|uniref:vesicle-associated membrane protein-associated protein B/C-like n=1 Tax=Centruroides sculpturatus TaxID=218467 RepID=UPI000C6D4A15|nr:vesicle-associated membrane protein-associated protein B/C-like [Centruroides sculpturatus]
MSGQLEISPSRLIFKGPYNIGSETEILLKNKETETVCFKIKARDPSKCLVSPSFGSVESDETVSIRIILLPDDSNSLEKMAHKFLIQTMHPPISGIDHEKMWTEADPTSIREKKLLCFFPDAPNLTSSTTVAEEKSDLQSVYTSSITEDEINYFKSLRVDIAKLTEGMGDLQKSNHELKTELSFLKSHTISRNGDEDQISAVESLHGNTSISQDLGGIEAENTTLEVSIKQENQSVSCFRYTMIASLCILNFLIGIIIEKCFDTV